MVTMYNYAAIPSLLSARTLDAMEVSGGGTSYIYVYICNTDMNLVYFVTVVIFSLYNVDQYKIKLDTNELLPIPAFYLHHVSTVLLSSEAYTV